VDEVLSATSEVLNEGGAAGFRLKNLANKLGVTAPSIYRFFPTKEELIRTAVVASHEEMMTRYADQVDQLAAPTTSVELFETLKRFVTEFSPERRQNNQIIRVRSMAVALYEPQLAARHGESVQRLNNAIESYIRRSQESGVVRSDIPALTVAQVVHALVSSGSLTTAEPVTPDELAHYWSAVEVALAGFLA
jgi:hypothetical protein